MDRARPGSRPAAPPLERRGHALRPAVPSLDGRRMHVVSTYFEGHITAETIFDFHEADGFVEASYAGGRVRSGHCVGRRIGDRFRLHYAQLGADDVIDMGKAELELELTGDGRVRVRQHSLSDFCRASGTSVIEEQPAPSESDALP